MLKQLRTMNLCREANVRKGLVTQKTKISFAEETENGITWKNRFDSQRRITL